MKHINYPLKGKFIKVIRREHGIKVISWFKNQGVDTKQYQGIPCEDEGHTYIYYGINKYGKFVQCSSNTIKNEKYEIIELPTELTFPRRMLTWDNDYKLKHERIVLFHNTFGNPFVPYIAVADCYVKNYENNLPYEVMSWKNAEELVISPIVKEMTLEQICKELGKEVKIIK